MLSLDVNGLVQMRLNKCGATSISITSLTTFLSSVVIASLFSGSNTFK